MAEQWLVVGLGNPGERYAGTRHNIGHFVVDELAARHQEKFRAHKAGAHVATVQLRPGGAKLILAKPHSFMNLSGTPVAALCRFFGVGAEELIVVHDDIDLPFDTIKIKSGGGHGGHNGVRDVAAALSTPKFTRVRVGVGRPQGRQDSADWVLSGFSSAERRALPVLVVDAADAVELIVNDGMLAAQQQFHSPR
jgi:PTH1 family peptidyl-tRNA hydrolase